MAKSRVLLEPRGLVVDPPAHYVGPESFTGGENITFRDAVVQRAGGFLSIWQEDQVLPDEPIHLLYGPHQGIGYWEWCSSNKIYVTDGLVHTDITPAAGLQTVGYNQWTSGELNGLPVFNNDDDAPVYWSGNPQQICETLPDWPDNTFAYALRPYKFHLVAMNIDGPGGLDDTFLMWSDAAAPGQVPQSWTIGTSSEAGNNVLGDEVGPIIDGLALRDDFIIYKRHSTYIMTYVGGDEVMAFRKLWSGVGLLTRNCVAELNGVHYLMSDGDIMAHDGQSIRSIADDRIKTTLFTFMDVNYFENSYVVANPTNNEIYFCVATAGIPEARYGVIYSVDSDNWSVRDIPSCPHGRPGIVASGVSPGELVDWDDFPTFWQYANRAWNETSHTIGSVNDGVLFAQPSGYNGSNVLFLDAATLSNGLVVDARLEHLSYDFESPGQVKIVRKVYPRISAPQDTEFTISVGGQINLNDGIAFQSQTFTIGQDDWVDILVMGKYISFTVTTEQDIIWTLTGYEVEYELRSRF